MIGELEEYLRGLDWVAAAGVRARDEGHVLHVECFVVPVAGVEPSVETLTDTQRACADLDWRLQDVVSARRRPAGRGTIAPARLREPDAGARE